MLGLFSTSYLLTYFYITLLVLLLLLVCVRGCAWSLFWGRERVNVRELVYILHETRRVNVY